MTIIEDTRQQIDKHKIENNQLRSLGVNILRSKLPVGDYANILNLSVVIDSKKDLQECVGNICGGGKKKKNGETEHERFRNECILARDNGIKLIVLVEHGWGIKSIEDVAMWRNPRIDAWERKVKSMQRKGISTAGMRPPNSGATLAKSMKTMQDKYGVEFMFCSRGDAGKKIIELLGGE
ncbi:ERCC4 domain-containing protein [Anaerocolumna sp. MB42-C2]|uniref:ERCC4 domain-containing protein n=1 Tax=Anaerocolumna sp. MB42-C2 TaxID=3070997 RepID=UPI0027DFAE1C|nr:ERCC4 domain-containing protein [Anaerocolumna sp. MB42-C2]WMJ85466.1 ERCC4 domain-containing protein [Anaerocolumna sp. MB42-C2]